MCLGLVGKLGSGVDPLIYIGPVILNTGDQMARKRNLYNPDSKEPYRLSRTKLENFLKCPRCFYLDRRLGVGQPPGFPFNINSAVDELLKREFDQCRANQVAHPYMVEAAIDAVPAIHPELDNWRKNFVGVSYVHTDSNFEVSCCAKYPPPEIKIVSTDLELSIFLHDDKAFLISSISMGVIFSKIF